MNMDVRMYEDNDLDEVNEILMEAFNRIKNNFKNDNIKEIVAVLDNHICGYLILTNVLNPIKNKYYTLIDYVCVSSKYRKMGVGKKLMEYAERICREEGVMYMQLSSSYDKVAAHKLYESCDFQKRESDLFRKELL